MGLLDKVLGVFSRRGSSLARYRSGMAKAKAGNFRAAIEDYTVVIEDKHVPADVKGMAMFNRSLAYSSIDNDAFAAKDLADMLSLKGLPENVRLQAQQRRSRITKRGHHQQTSDELN